MPQDSEKEKAVERRSLVGMPPTMKKSQSGATPARPQRAAASRTASTAARSHKKQPVSAKTEDDSDNDEERKDKEKEEGSEEEESNEEQEPQDEEGTPKRAKRKRKRAYLTDYTTRKKKALSAKKPKPEPQPVEEEEESGDEQDKDEEDKEEDPRNNVKQPSVMRYTPLQLMCDHLLRKIMAKDPEEYFAFPVLPSQAPDYYTIITQPMDFSKIRTKIEENGYDNLAEMRVDFDLIVSNAMTYNESNTVYHHAAIRLGSIIKYYFSENYLRYVFHSLPFANRVPLEKCNLKPLAPIKVPLENERREAYVDDMTIEDCLNAAHSKVRDKLTARVPTQPNGKLSFLSNKDGKTVLNVIGDPSRQGLKLGDLVGKLDEGNPGLLTLSDNSGFRFANQAMPITYLTYGTFSSFAPQYDSTWATLTKHESDLLLRTYGDRVTVSDVVAMRNLVSDAGEHMVVDDLLDFLTDGEHNRTQKCLSKQDPPMVEIAKDSIGDLLDDIETLENLGIDVSFVPEVRQRLHVSREQDMQSDLNCLGHAIADLSQLQNSRLSQQPPATLTKVSPPGQMEMKLAQQVQDRLVTQIRTIAPPGQLVSDSTIHSAMGEPGDIDADILNEFFM
ncbi:hypothetical protein WR25_11569 [Diploscapter pachys]|uniref:Bromo domain-containing protein n=1 Tax=Diploscapter pachys TaxID=2018661 RepID=A0A2A2JQ08_9BILA|nr:hypothetical protein WR25_11569 [Diploscapter pachys]